MTKSAAVKAPILPPEAAAQLAQVHRGMQRAEVEEIFGPRANNIALLNASLLTDYYWLTPNVTVRVDFMLKQVSPPRCSEDDVVVRTPDTLSVAERIGQKHIRWTEVPIPNQ